jgi:hypothetical protein
MTTKTLGIVIVLTAIISIGSVLAISSFLGQVSSNSDSTTPTVNPTSQPTIQPVIQTYTGYLVSFNYVTSQTNGVESTQLVFTNKTFNYAGYLSVENDCAYIVTYYENNPNQVLDITNLNSITILMGSDEQVSIANIAFVGTNQIDVLVQNAGSSSANFTAAYINGVAATITNPSPLTVGKSSSTTFHVTSPSALSSGTAYQIKLITTKGNQIQNSAVYSPSPTPSSQPQPTDVRLMGNTEQASIVNIAFVGTNQIDVLVQNTGSTTVNISYAYINGVATTITNAPPLSVSASGATTFHLTSPSALSAGTSYQIKLITAKGTQIQNSAVYNP